MIDTFYGLDLLGSPAAFLAALAIGGAFGFALERAGLGSSRRLTGIFYFRDMTVLRVMFTAMVTAMLGLSLASGLGLIDVGSQVYLMPSIYGAQVVGGLIFGVGFVVGGWCPGTAAVGLASGKVDALVFLGSAVGGSILFNELYPLGAVQRLFEWGDGGTAVAFSALGMSRAGFALLVTVLAVGCFWGAEYLEWRVSGTGWWRRSRFLQAFSVVLAVAALGLFLLPERPAAAGTGPGDEERGLLAAVDAGLDHFGPEELADRMMRAEPGLRVIDVRGPEEYGLFHLRGAENVPIAELAARLEPSRNRGLVVLYSNGMTHPAQARDALARLGHANVYILTDGLEGFKERCLKPVSLRPEPVPAAEADRIRAWREHFLDGPAAKALRPGTAGPAGRPGRDLGHLISASSVRLDLHSPRVRILDCRPQPEYNRGHIPGSLSLQPDNLRGNVGGKPSMLLPADLLARRFSLMGVAPDHRVVLVDGGRPHDATLLAMALERLGHADYALLDGGFPAWVAEGGPTDRVIPAARPVDYPAPAAPDGFTVDAAFVLERVRSRDAVIVDVRPAEYYRGEKSDEARAGHIPGAISRPYTEDQNGGGTAARLADVAELARAYGRLALSRDARIVVHCRTGHQASQTWFVLVRLLGYRNVSWYDAGWTDWAARPELPVEVPAAGG